MNGLKTSALIIALAMLLALPLTASAQEEPICPGGGPGMEGPPGPHRGLMGRLGEELGLSEEQKEQIRAIVAEEMPAARQRIEERVDALLTPEQQEKLAALKADHPMLGRGEGKGKGRGMRGQGRHPGARLARMAEALELTDEQQTAIREILAEAAPPKPVEVKEKINQVLTPEQQEKMAKLHETRRERMAQRREF